MLTNLAHREVSTSGITETRNFSIEANGKAFKVLIDGLYSDKQRAVVRELWSNAFDSHIAVGTPDLPFDCQLPTVFDPVFRVRDYGVSLSHEDVMGLYTTVFRSTKDGTNTQVGKLGLGSKSPFAYVDTFSVTCWLAGEKRVYSAFIGEDYVPQIAFMGSEASDEPHGLEVAFPVQSDDVEAFATAAKKVALGFKVLPNIIGRQVTFVELETVMEDAPLWSLVKAHDWQFNARTAYARQGCVVYPIDAGAIRNITDVQSAILRSPFFIEFPIGDLEIAASREALGYTPNTCKNILRAVDVIIDELRRRYQADLSSAATYWDACVAYSKLQAGALHEGVKKAISEGLTWNNRKLVTTIQLGDALFRSHALIHAMRATPGLSRRRKSIKWEPSSQTNVTPATDVVYLEDIRQRTSMVAARVRFDFDRHHLASSIVWIKADPTSWAWKRLYVTMGRPTIIPVENLAKPPVEKGYGVKKPVSMRVLSRHGGSFEPTLIDEDDDIVYVNLERGDINGPLSATSTVSANSVFEVRSQLIKFGALPADTQIIGVPRTHAKKITRNTHWRSLWDVAREAVNNNFDEKKAAIAEACAEIAADDHFDTVKGFIADSQFPAFKGSARRLLRFYMAVHERAKDCVEQRAWLSLARTVRGNVTLPDYRLRWEPIGEAFVSAYPMIRLIGGYVNPSDRYQLLRYVNLVDSSLAGAQSVTNADEA